MTTDRFTKLLELVQDTDKNVKNELMLVHNGKIEAMKAFNARPGKDTRADLAACREEYDETVERYWKLYFPEEAPTPEGERFKTRKTALDWIKAQGYQVSTGKFYQDCDSGFPAVHKDKTVSRFQVMQYVQQLDVERKSTSTDRAEEKEQLEINKLRLEVERRQIENRRDDDKWLNKETAYAHMAAIIGTLRDSLRHHFQVGSPALVHLAGGDHNRAPELYEGVEDILAKSFNEIVARGRIETVFEETDEI